MSQSMGAVLERLPELAAAAWPASARCLRRGSACGPLLLRLRNASLAILTTAYRWHAAVHAELTGRCPDGCPAPQRACRW